MKELKRLKAIWHKLLFILNPSQKKWGIVVFFLTLGGAVFETFGVSVIVPLVQMLIQPEVFINNEYMQLFMRFFNLKNAQQAMIGIVILVIALYLFKNSYLIFLSWVRSKYSCKIQRELSVSMLDAYLKREYEFFLNNNIGDLMRGVSTDIQGVYHVIYQGFRIVTEILTMICIFIYICVTDWIMALSLITLAGLCLIGILFGFKRKMGRLGELNRRYAATLNQHLLHAFQGIKEVTVMQRQSFFLKQYEKTYIEKQKCEVGQVVGTESPAFIIEAVCVSGVLLAVWLRINSLENAQAYVPLLASFAVAAFRILPSLGRLSSSFNQFMYVLPSLDAVYDNISEVKEYTGEMAAAQEKKEKCAESKMFNTDLKLSGVSWKYAQGKDYVLKDLELVIQKGQSVAFVGQSGAGKTTLADLLLGILKPKQGMIMMDGIDILSIPEEWHRIIGYVPQNIYLTEQSIKENVAFGKDKKEIDDEKVWRSLQQAQLAPVILELPDGIDTLIGERGIKLSGGQRQRIAIARALYENPEIIIFDEATAALDNETERAVMESLEALQGEKTLIIIAHRLTTIRNCDIIYEIVNGKAKIRKYEELVK